MKKIHISVIAMFLFALLLSSCGKEKMVIRNGHAISDDDNNNNYVWTSCQPKPITFERGEFVSGSGVNAIYWYYFNISLDNSQANATRVTVSDIVFPHVGPLGTTIYNNVTNDATYEVVSVNNGVVRCRIKTANVVAAGCPLKFNLALSVSGTYVWFSANGSLTQNVGIDDGNNNLYFINFNNGSIKPAF